MSIAYHFWSTTCPPCVQIKPSIQLLKEDFSDTTWVSVNVKEDPHEYVSKFGVKSWPTIVTVSKSGKVFRHSGTDMAGYFRILRQGEKD